MSAGAGIPIRVKENRGCGSPSGLGGGLRAVMHEIAGMLRKLAETGEGGHIDLRSLPTNPGELEDLKKALGEGEATVDLRLETGLSRCRETSIPGVWWIAHQDAGGDTVAEFIEVAQVPEILVLETADIHEGVARLEEKLRRAAD